MQKQKSNRRCLKRKLPEATTPETLSTSTVTPTEFATPPSVEMDNGYGTTPRRAHADNRVRKKSGACDKKNPKYTDLINELKNKILIEQEPATVLITRVLFIYFLFIYLFKTWYFLLIPNACHSIDCCLLNFFVIL